MIDQYHLRRQVSNAKQGGKLLGLDASAVNWQQYALLLAYGQGADIASLNEYLMKPSWFKGGYDEDSGIANSLYLSPKGQPFYVRYAGHSTLVYDLMGLAQERMNRAGWLHISDARVSYYGHINPRQRRWLDANPPKGASRWHEKQLANGFFKHEPYPEAEVFDVAPAEDEDRFYMRLYRGFADTPLPTSPVETGHGVMPCA